MLSHSSPPFIDPFKDIQPSGYPAVTADISHLIAAPIREKSPLIDSSLLQPPQKSLKKKQSVTFPNLETVLEYRDTEIQFDQQNESFSITPLFPATVMYDFKVPDENSSDYAGAISIYQGTIVSVFGNPNELVLPEKMSNEDILNHIEVFEGWCQVQTDSGEIGFVPLSFLEFVCSNEKKTLKITSSPHLFSNADQQPGKPPLLEKFIYPSAWSYTALFISDRLKSSVATLKNWFNEVPKSNKNVVEDYLKTPLTISIGEIDEGDDIRDSGSFGFFTPSESLIGETFLDEKSFQKIKNRFSSVSTTQCSNSVFGTYLIESGPTWKSSTPIFDITVTSPTKNKKIITDGIGPSSIVEEYISYNITSTFLPPSFDGNRSNSQIEEINTISVHRRFKDFEWFHSQLHRVFPSPSIVIPSLPTKIWRMDDSSVEARRGALDRYLNLIVSHPILRAVEVVMVFLWCGGEYITKNARNKQTKKVRKEPLKLKERIVSAVEESEWSMAKSVYEEMVANEMSAKNERSRNFYKRVYHPGLGVSRDNRLMTKYENHLELIDEHTKSFADSVQAHQSSVQEMSLKYENLGASLSSLAVGNSSDIDDVHGRLIREFSWCWRDGCKDCAFLAKRMNAVSKQIKEAGKSLDLHVSRDVSPFIDSVKEFKSTLPAYKAICDLNSVATTRYQDILKLDLRSVENDEKATRVGTIVNASLCEVEYYHEMKQKIWKEGMKNLVNGMLETHEAIVENLMAAKVALESI